VVAEPDGIREESITLSASPASLTDLQGGDAPQNAAILAGILDGSDRGPRRELVLANTAAALQVTGTASSWEEALALADEAVDSGKALAVLHALQQFGRTAQPG